MKRLFLSPHNDDAALFGAFTLQALRPVVLTVFDSWIQLRRGHPGCDATTRRREDIEAIKGALGCAIQFAGVRDDLSLDAARSAVIAALKPWAYSVEEVWIPEIDPEGHDQHNLVGEIGADLFKGARIHRYLTYTRRGKSRDGVQVPFTGAMIRRKLLALSCYRTQIEIDALGCGPHFMRDQYEYVREVAAR